MPRFYRILVALFGTLALLVGSRWLYLFTLTKYRRGRRNIMIPLGTLAVCSGILALWAAKAFGGNQASLSDVPDEWDKQIEGDLASGKLDRVLEEVDAEIQAGKAKPL